MHWTRPAISSWDARILPSLSTTSRCWSSLVTDHSMKSQTRRKHFLTDSPWAMSLVWRTEPFSECPWRSDPISGRWECYPMDGGDWPDISSSYKRYIVSANHRHHRPYPTNRIGDSGGTMCGSGPNDPQTAKRDQPKIVPVLIPAFGTSNWSWELSELLLHNTPFVSADKLFRWYHKKNRSSGHNDLTSA